MPKNFALHNLTFLFNCLLVSYSDKLLILVVAATYTDVLI